MCPSIDETPANGANGTNGDASNGQYTAIETRAHPAPHHKSSPYQPVGDFLSNISRFKIIESTLRGEFMQVFILVGDAWKLIGGRYGVTSLGTI